MANEQKKPTLTFIYDSAAARRARADEEPEDEEPEDEEPKKPKKPLKKIPLTDAEDERKIKDASKLFHQAFEQFFARVCSKRMHDPGDNPCVQCQKTLVSTPDNKFLVCSLAACKHPFHYNCLLSLFMATVVEGGASFPCPKCNAVVSLKK